MNMLLLEMHASLYDGDTEQAAGFGRVVLAYDERDRRCCASALAAINSAYKLLFSSSKEAT